MCAHGRGRNPMLPPEYTAATSGEVSTLFGVCFVFPKLLTPACLLEVLHLEVYDCFPFFSHSSGTCKSWKFQLLFNPLESHQSWQIHGTAAPRIHCVASR